MSTDDTYKPFRSIVGHVRPVLPREGKIRLGIRQERARGAGFPKEVDFFVFERDLPHRARLVELFGERPKRLAVMLPDSDFENIMPHAYKAYVGGGSGRGGWLLCTGNGEVARRAETVVEEWYDKRAKQQRTKKVAKRDAQGRVIFNECPCPCPWLDGKRCSAKANLFIQIPSVAMGVYQIDTGSIHAMTNIKNKLVMYRAMFGEDLTRMMFWLVRKPRETSAGGVNATHYVLDLDLMTKEEIAKWAVPVKQLLESYCVLPSRKGLHAGVENDPALLPPGSPVEETDLVSQEILEHNANEDIGAASGEPVASGVSDDAGESRTDGAGVKSGDSPAVTATPNEAQSITESSACSQEDGGPHEKDGPATGPADSDSSPSPGAAPSFACNECGAIFPGPNPPEWCPDCNNGHVTQIKDVPLEDAKPSSGTPRPREEPKTRKKSSPAPDAKPAAQPKASTTKKQEDFGW